MWKYPRMVALVGVMAAMYYASLLFIRFAPILPGISADRIGVVIPIVFSYLFGPVAPWAAAFGNVLGDISTGSFNGGSFFGFVANFAIGYVPYRAWRAVTAAEPSLNRAWKIALFIYLVALVNAIAGDVIGWGVNWLFGVPLAIVVTAVMVSNTFWGATFGTVLQGALYRVLKGHYPMYGDIMGKSEPSGMMLLIRRIALVILSVGAFGGMIFAVYYSPSPSSYVPFLVVITIGAALI